MNARIWPPILTALVTFACNANPEPAPDEPEPAVCSAAQPVCGDGCGAGFVCDTSCACVEEACQPDAPVCDGSGPNDGCDAGFVCNTGCACESEPPPPPSDRLARPSRSTPVDISVDDTVVAMVNTDDGSVSFFNATPDDESRIARVASSATANAEPMTVVIAPSGDVAYVANRAAGSVARITDIATANAARDAEVTLGGEPIGLALTPSGATLWVTNWVDGTVTVLDTTDLSIVRTIDVGGNPFAIALTNDGDTDDDDEKALVTQFYARRRAGPNEAVDDGAEGVVHVIDVEASAPRGEIVLAPIADCFTAPIGEDVVTSACFVNQLNGITIHEAFGSVHAYVTSVAASPAGPVQFNHNVQAVVSVIDVEAETELVAQTTNLNSLVKLQVDDDGDETIGRRFLSVIDGIAFVNRDDLAIGYVTAAGSDIMLRVVYEEDGAVSVGAPTALNIPVGQNPQGLVVRHGTTGARAYTANLVSRDLSVVSFRDQRTVNTVESTPKPADPTSPEGRVWRGKRFFNTGTGIWSREGWGSCQGCHPMGLTDNVTWSFAAGPRQTISLDGQYASNDPSDMRALNWTAIFDETADFELNTRGVSGGSGALRNADGPLVSPAGPPFAALTVEDASSVENHQALNGSLTFIARQRDVCANEATCVDWDLIDEYIRTIRSPNAKTAPANRVQQGRAVYEDAGCNKCHAGAKWTVSRTFYTPESFVGALPDRTFAANAAASTAMDPGALVGLPLDVNVDATLIAGDDSDGGAPALKRQACNIRNVGTFGSAEGAEELRANGSPAQGRNGFNPPSLLGLSTGAPYLHHGAAKDLDGLFDSRFDAHTKAGNPNFAPTAAEREALTAFLLAIDERTATFPIDPQTVLCPVD